jgi:hypothetical protein
VRFIRLLWRREATNIEPSGRINPRCTELETAKEILAERSRVKPYEVEEMIRKWMEERSWTLEQAPEDGLWPATFCLVE